MRWPVERRAPRGDLLLFGACLFLSLLSLAMPHRWAAGLTSGLRASLLRPLVMLQDRAAQDRTSRFRITLIETERDSLARLLHDDLTLRSENQSLRSLLMLPQRVTLPMLAATVLHQPIQVDERMLLLGIGSEAGARQFDPVVTAEGLLGYVWDTEPNSAVVLTWLHPEFRAHAVTEDGSVMGMIVPRLSSTPQAILEFRGVALLDTVPVGTRVYTSSLGGVYPRGIPIGTIAAEAGDSLAYERVYRVIPFVNPGMADHAMVLRVERGARFLPLPGDSLRP